MLVAALLLLAGHVPAQADATVFVGAFSSATTRAAVGAAIGFFPLETGQVLGFEVELARAPWRHRIQTTGGSFIVQQSFSRVQRWQLYGLMGLSVYGETVDSGDALDQGLAAHFGGGVKVALVGPLRLRLDYRMYIPEKEHFSFDIGHPRRIAAGIALAF